MTAGTLSRRRARALVVARLEALGHEPGFVTAEALEVLRQRAGAGEFAAALGAVLFLASTEDAPRVESRHVEQAVPLEGKPAAGGLQVWHVAAASLIGLAVGALLALGVARGPAAPAPAPAPIPRPAIVTAPAEVVTLLPSRVLVPRPLATLPEGPPVRVTLVVPAGDREAAAHAADLARRLRGRGVADVQQESFNSARIDARARRHHVVYYFRQDLPFAENLASTLDSIEDSSHIASPWAPILVPEAAGASSHPPGSLDVFAP